MIIFGAVFNDSGMDYPSDNYRHHSRYTQLLLES